MDYKRMTSQELKALAASGEYGARLELQRRQARRNPDPRMKKDGTPFKRQAGAAKAAREAKYTDKQKAAYARARKVMSRARDLMEDLGWYPGEAIRQAWSEEKAGKLAAYAPRTRAATPAEIKAAVSSKGMKNNPFGYGYPF